MEEDIKIIEECKIMDDTIPHSEHSKRLRKALENLIKGYRELEGKIEKQKHSFIDGYFEGGNNQHNIWVSKIKEIRDKAEVMDYYTLNNVIDDLTKLLGDE